ncbi:ABC transporter permease [Clostridium psychrophilum]|uniref:ABC transporter permease n=1 Tax=Clostridium psychrophilum TaxID=132926 RepID=UPI001C0ABC6C|nr:FtsX-like permease family protein [Clostridium psychrophilum]MBU3181973.1 ABC transporter permease [Clostridium psychrophilum]
MKIFFKYIVKSMLEKKARFCLLILAIALSTGLLVTVSGTVKIAINSFEKPMMESFEGKEIAITSKKTVPFFNMKAIKEVGVKNINGEIDLSATTNGDETNNVTIRGKEEKNINKDNLIEGDLSKFTGEKCIISKRTSEEKKLKINDELELFIAGESKKYKVVAISANEGAFYNDNKTNYQIIVPYKYVAQQFKMEGKYNYVTANKSLNNPNESINKFNKNNTQFVAKELYDAASIEKQIGSFTQILYAMLAIVLFMSAIIIYGSFKLTITERLPVIGTFLSQGATNWTVEKILLLESIGYGIVGAIFGDILGYGGLYLINYFISPLKNYGIIEKFSVNSIYFVIGAIFAIVFSCISAIVPIIKIRKLEVKEVILNNVNISIHIGWVKFIIGTIILVVTIFVNSIDTPWVNTLSSIFILASIIGLVFVYPKVIDLVTNVLYKIFRGRSKVIVFALNNLRTSKVLMGNITLIVISMLSIFMITSIGTSMKDVVTGAYKQMDFDVSVSGIKDVSGIQGVSVTDKLISKIKDNKNVNKDSIQIVKLVMGSANKDTMIVLEGIDSKKYQKFNGYLELDSDKYRDMYKKFDKSTDSEIIITDKLKRALNVNVGNKITIEVNDIKKNLKIIGTMDGKVYNNGQFVLMKNDVMKKEFNVIEANQIAFKTTKSPEIVKKQLKTVVKNFGATATTRDEFQKRNLDQNQMIVNILSIFSYLAIFIAALGVLNNITIGFLQRKRELAVLSSVGMSDGARNGMLLWESVFSVVWSVVIAIPYSYLGLSLLTKTMTAMEMPMHIVLDIKSVPIYAVAALVLIVLGSLPIMLKSNKLSIINELKYE